MSWVLDLGVDILRWFLLTMLIAAWSITRLTLKTNPYSAGSWRPFAAPLGWRWHLDEVSEAIEVDLSPLYLQT